MAHTDLVSVLRRPDGLYASLVERQKYFRIPDATVPEEALRDHDPFREREVPLGDTGRLGFVRESWEALARVDRLDAEVLADLVTVVAYSLPDETAGRGPAPLSLERERATWRPTAAHPRAYKGTKDRPPKPRMPARVDLRPHLANPRDVNALVRRLAPFGGEASSLLKRRDVLGRDLPPLAGIRDLFMACVHPEAEGSLHALPDSFRRGFLFWLRGMPWKHVRGWLALYWNLQLESRPPLRRCLSRLLARSLTPDALDWATLVAQQPRERQVAFAELVVEAEVGRDPCTAEIRACVARVDDLTPDGFYRHRTFALLGTIRKGGPPGTLVSGIELAQEFQEKHAFEPLEEGAPVPVESIRSAADHATDGYLAMRLWQACAEFAGLGRLLTSIAWRDLPPKSARELLPLLTSPFQDDNLDKRARARKAAALHGRAPEILECLRSLPESFQSSALDHLWQVAWLWDEPEKLDWAIGEYAGWVLPRLSRLPCRRDGFESKALVALTYLEPAQWDELRRARDAFFTKLVRACRRKNDAERIWGGLRFLARHEGTRLAGSLGAGSSSLLETARALGWIGESVRRDALRAWRAHPILDAGVTELRVEELVRVLGALPIRAEIPRRLREGGLTPNQVERARRVLLDSLPAIRWRLLGHLCLERLAVGLPPVREQGAIHAVRLYGTIEDNRRAFRRFLEAYLKGDRDYLGRHPLNRNWLRLQRRVNRRAWLEGMTKETALQGGAPVRLHVELDPLEALRMGTVVGSCTGLGGSFAYSAAATVLDLNKHVVYGRTARGTVLARQVVALSDDEQLVCFEVYPLGVPDDLKRLFREFDLEFAARLGVEVHQPGEESNGSGKVEKLLSREWWDDHAWDLSVDRE